VKCSKWEILILETERREQNRLSKRDKQNTKQTQGPKEEMELVNEFGKHEEDQPVPQPKDYNEIEY